MCVFIRGALSLSREPRSFFEPRLAVKWTGVDVLKIPTSRFRDLGGLAAIE